MGRRSSPQPVQTSDISGRGPSRLLQGLLWGALVLILIVVGLAAVSSQGGLRRLFGSGVEPELSIYGTVPPFSLTERSGRTVTQADLAGRIWVADFIFTRCGTICPALSGTMARLQSRLRGQGGQRPRLVSFSVDPAADTPAVLRDYAHRFGADAEQWLFLTGKREELYDLIDKGFHLGVAQRDEKGVTDPNQLITHTDRFVLVDRKLRIRGYYRGLEAAAVDDILRDVARLRAER